MNSKLFMDEIKDFKNVAELKKEEKHDYSKLPLDSVLYEICKFLNVKELIIFILSGKFFYSKPTLRKFLLRCFISNRVNSLFRKKELIGVKTNKSNKKEIKIKKIIKETLVSDNLVFNEEIISAINYFFNLEKLKIEELGEFFTKKDRERCKKVETLTIKNLPLKYFPPFTIFPNVKEIVIEDTDLEEFVIDDNFPNLEILRIENNNKLKKIIIINGHEHLIKILGRNNSLMDLIIANCRNLKHLVLNDNLLKEIDGQGCKNLKQIFCNKNYFKSKDNLVNIPENCELYGLAHQKFKGNNSINGCSLM